jgi:predicted flap endonuclease-1-like 5' DNA nuclease
MDELTKQVSHKSFIQPFAANQKKKKKRKGILLSLFSLVNRLVMMTMLVVLLRWWLQREHGEGTPSQTSRGEEIALDRYGVSSGIRQPQTAPIHEPAVSGYEATWPEPEVSLSQAEAAPIEELTEPERNSELDISEPAISARDEFALADDNASEQEQTTGLNSQTAPDDLSLIEGIGPKISNLLQSAGIHTFQQLAETETGRIEEILQESGLRLANPETWPEQARYLADGDTEGLRQLQSQLKAGRRL